MIYFPPLRRVLLPTVVILLIIVCYRSTSNLHSNFSSYVIRQPVLGAPGTRILLNETETREVILHQSAQNYLSPPTHLYYTYDEPVEGQDGETPTWKQPARNVYLQPLLKCPLKPNKFTNHIRLPNPLRNISFTYKGESDNEKLNFLNPAILSLPYWSKNQYLIVNRVQTDGSHQQNLLCEANICYVNTGEGIRDGEVECTAEDIRIIGPGGGMRCATTPITLNVPPTPAKTCGEGTGILMDIPGFHDPRIFWTGKGEPLMMVNTQSRYACFGLWAIDLRKLHPPLETLLESEPNGTSIGPLMSYPSLTELTRNPPDTRGPIEKNWMFFSSRQSSFIHYDIAPARRTFAKLLGGGLTTVNLTDPMELSCINAVANQKKVGSWHQSTNSLRLILCDRSDETCIPNVENTVFFSMIHHKIKGHYGLPIRYERYFIVWSATPPFSMLGMSQHAMLMANETATGWSEEENWADDDDNRRRLAKGEKGKPMFAVFTYTVSIGYAWGRANDTSQDKNLGYLDDEVVVGVGIDDGAQMYSRVKARDLLQCLRACPGRAAAPMKVVGTLTAEEKKSDTNEKLADVMNVAAAGAAVAGAGGTAVPVESGLPTKGDKAAKATGSSAKEVVEENGPAKDAATAKGNKVDTAPTVQLSTADTKAPQPAADKVNTDAAQTSHKLPVTLASKPAVADTAPLPKEEGAAPPPLPNKAPKAGEKAAAPRVGEKAAPPPKEAVEALLPKGDTAAANLDGGEAVAATVVGGGGEVGANPPTLADEKEKAKVREDGAEALKEHVKDKGAAKGKST